MMFLKIFLLFSNIQSINKRSFAKIKLEFKDGAYGRAGQNTYYISSGDWPRDIRKTYVYYQEDGYIICVIKRIILRTKSLGCNGTFHIYKIDGELKFIEEQNGDIIVNIEREKQFKIKNITRCKGILGFGYMQGDFFFPDGLFMKGFWFDLDEYLSSFYTASNHKYKKLD